MTNQHSVDSSNMRDVIAKSWQQFAKGFEWSSHISLANVPNQVVVAGMGGSALSADLVNSIYVNDLPQPILVSRNYQVPRKWLETKPLVIICSFSGNTEETIAAYEQVKAAGCQAIVIASGGKLVEIANSFGDPVIQLVKESPTFQPRMGLGYFFSALVATLISANWLPVESKDNILEDAQKLSEFDNQSAGEAIAQTLENKIPIFYAPDHLWPVARIAKIKINENSKMPAFWNFLPEANHNEMVGFTKIYGDYAMVMITDPDDDPRLGIRFAATSDILRQTNNIPSEQIIARGENLFLKTFYVLNLLDWVSYYLAIKQNIDPTPVVMVEDFKKSIEDAQSKQ